MDERLERETEGLIRSWMRHDERMLRDYLIGGVEDPRINIQSILSRHFLIEALCGERFAVLKRHELQFGAVMNWLVKLAKQTGGAEDFAAVLHALQRGADNAEGLPIPAFVLQAFTELPADADGLSVPHFLIEILAGSKAVRPGGTINEEQLSLFARLWRQGLGKELPRQMSVLEPACGSANDYRFLEAFGIARLVNYEGFDLCEKNVQNARAMFPAARFEPGNVFEIRAEDKSFDVCFVHDLFEHLSIEGMQAALDEICRVAREGICAGFFSMHEEDDHIVRPTEDYHWNTLSLARTSELFEKHGFSVQAIHIGTFLRWHFGGAETHNDNAYTFWMTADEDGDRIRKT
ncbi:MAG: class I SAM-dependent methyltransferase [Verrucomicrobia bacterium]|nr:class I SAM-dependent methyltransferase [Verrucomicrobiota bacterium]